MLGKFQDGGRGRAILNGIIRIEKVGLIATYDGMDKVGDMALGNRSGHVARLFYRGIGACEKHRLGNCLVLPQRRQDY
jgi:hypothetical protein